MPLVGRDRGGVVGEGVPPRYRARRLGHLRVRGVDAAARGRRRGRRLAEGDGNHYIGEYIVVVVPTNFDEFLNYFSQGLQLQTMTAGGGAVPPQPRLGLVPVRVHHRDHPVHRQRLRAVRRRPARQRRAQVGRDDAQVARPRLPALDLLAGGADVPDGGEDDGGDGPADDGRRGLQAPVHAARALADDAAEAVRRDLQKSNPNLLATIPARAAPPPGWRRRRRRRRRRPR